MRDAEPDLGVTLRVLHLSDLRHDGQADTLDSLWARAAEWLRPASFDAVFISGDVSRRAHPAEYSEFMKFMRAKLVPLLVKSQPGRIVFAPGNHDVDWSANVVHVPPIGAPFDPARRAEEMQSALRDFQVHGGASSWRAVQSYGGHVEMVKIDEASYKTRFSNFQRFLDEHLLAADTEAGQFRGADFMKPGCDWSARLFPDHQVAAVAFNSCHRIDQFWHGPSIDPHSILHAMEYLRKNAEQFTWVAIWHHGVSSTARDHNYLSLKDLAALQHGGFTVGFHGHTHRGALPEDWGNPKGIRLVATGPFAHESRSRPDAVGRQFSVVEIGRGSVKVDVYSANDLGDFMVQRNEPRGASVFVSFGGPDQAIACRIVDALELRGLSAWFFPRDAAPGAKLHREMSDRVNEHDHILLLCSRASLGRPGVLNELEGVLQREAREGGTSLLVPVALDDHVFGDWAPSRSDLARQVRDRVICDLRDAPVDTRSFDAVMDRLAAALKERRPV